MPKVPLCEQCDQIIDEDLEKYVDVTEHSAGLEDWQVAYVHAACYPAWRKGYVGDRDEK